MLRDFAFATVFCWILGGSPSAAQVTPAVLEIEIQNLTGYNADIFDASKFATDSNRTAVAAVRNFGFSVGVGDIVMVNGKPAKGTFLVSQRLIGISPTPTGGQGIADSLRNAITENLFDIQQADGSTVGSIYVLGLAGGNAPPGAPAGTVNNLAITGGTGAFLGIRGQMSGRSLPGIPAFRPGSVTEDPGRRRELAAGERVQFIAQVIPMTRPEIAMLASGPAVFHADFSPVTVARPARSGEVLIVRATGLGPTRSGFISGQPFPADPLQEVNAPVEVLVGDRAAEVVTKVGWPGSTDAYRIDFRVPDGTPAGLVTVRLSAAWIDGPDISLSVQ